MLTEFIVNVHYDVPPNETDEDNTIVTLREALIRANDEFGPDTIHFAIPGTSMIQLTEGEISITDSVLIDAQNQPITIIATPAIQPVSSSPDIFGR